MQVDRLAGLRRVCLPVAQLYFRKKKLKKTIGQSKNPRTVRKKKILAGTPELERVTKDERASLFSAQQSVWNKAGPGPDAPSLTQTLIVQSVYCALTHFTN